MLSAQEEEELGLERETTKTVYDIGKSSDLKEGHAGASNLRFICLGTPGWKQLRMHEKGLGRLRDRMAKSASDEKRHSPWGRAEIRPSYVHSVCLARE